MGREEASKRRSGHELQDLIAAVPSSYGTQVLCLHRLHRPNDAPC